MVDEAWQAWVWVAAIDVAVVIAAWLASTARAPLDRLLPHHVAGAVVVALIGWEIAVNQVGTVSLLSQLAGFQVAFVASQVIAAASAAVATIFILRRRSWAIVLGVGVCVVRIVAAVIGLVGLFALGPAFVDDPSMLSTVAYVILAAVPAVAGIWLLLDPFLRGSVRWPAADRDGPAAAPERSATPDPSREP